MWPILVPIEFWYLTRLHRKRTKRGRRIRAIEFYRRTATTTQSGINHLKDLAYDSMNARLYVADFTNNRVMV